MPNPMKNLFNKNASFIFLIVWVLMTGMAVRVPLTDRDLPGQIPYGGILRDYILHVPAGYETMKERALVIVLHGSGGTAKGQIWLTKSSFNRMADKDGFFVVYPEGLGKSWNDGRQDGKAYAREHHIDDAGFLKALAAELGRKYPIDPRKVFFDGHVQRWHHVFAAGLRNARNFPRDRAGHGFDLRGNCARVQRRKDGEDRTSALERNRGSHRSLRRRGCSSVWASPRARNPDGGDARDMDQKERL